ncbi:MAG TPA: C25 family cysteine peptidase [Crocinitomicaceae bacterium]|nr:C25 family cysteine peptidase [Crocinitomicaceae bacterium]
MKQLLLLLTFCLFGSSFFAQVNGNEWINYNQSYYRFNVYATGVHKLTYETLTTAGIDFSAIDPSRFQLFGRQKEIPIFIVDGNDNSFDAGDYILFFAEKNDGWLDSLVYVNSAGIGNPAYSLYSDTLSYFFSWNNSTNNLRYQWADNQNFGSVTNQTNYLLKKSFLSFNNVYYDLKSENSYSSSSYFLDGEGWGANQVNGVNGSTQLFNLPTPLPYTGAGAPTTKFTGLSISNSSATNTATPTGPNHNMAWLIGTAQLQFYFEEFSGYQQKRVYFDFPTNMLVNGNTPVRYRIAASSNYATDYQAVSYIAVEYPMLPSLNNQNFDRFTIDNNTLHANSKLILTQAPLSNQGLIFVQGSQPKVIPTNLVSADTYQCLIPNTLTGTQQEIIVSNADSYITVGEVKAVSANARFEHYTVDPNDDKVVLMIYNSQLEASSQNYADYRRSPAGGSYTVILADIDQLSMQYGGGIDKHILAIRRFAQDISNSSNFIPQALYLLGKATREANGARKNQAFRNYNLVPSFGYPSSDVLITAGLGNTIWEPLIPTGRISVLTNQELDDYLDKVKLHDAYNDPNAIAYTSENRDWQKHIIHFSGGATISDQNEFSYYLKGMENIIKDSLYGAEVLTIKKENSLPLDPVAVSEVTDRISKGASILNFFGHASADGFEINVDEPSNWNNEGKYPLVIGNSCYSGDIYQATRSISEHFVLTPQVGAIAFMSTVTTGFAFSLNYFSAEFYKQIGYKNYRKPLGYLMKATIKDVRSQYTPTIYTETTCQQMSLHGDPLLVLNSHEKSEIEISDASLYFEPTQFDLTTDSITAHLILTNIGKSVTDTFTIDFTRTYPNGVDSVYHFTLPKLNYKDTLSFRFPMGGSDAGGINEFAVDVDLPSQIDEYENIVNNQIKKNLFINIDGISPVYPYNFAVVPNDTVTVRASTINPLASWKTYRFEIDTTDLYNSPEKRYALVSGYGGVKEVKHNQWLSTSGTPKPLTCTDSTVYFWRVSIDSSVLSWKEHSFQYIPDKSGWGQAHFFQFKNNNFYGIDYRRPERDLIFDTVQQTIGAKVINKPSSTDELNGSQTLLNGQTVEYGICTTTPSFYLSVYDPITLIPWKTFWNGQNPEHQFGNANDGSACRNRLEQFFIFRQNSTQQLENFQNMIAQIPDGHYVSMYSGYRVDTTLWNSTPTSIFQTFTDLGATQIQTAHNKSFAFVFRKGDPTFVHEALTSEQAGELLILSVPVSSHRTDGEEKSPMIGGAKKWETIYWKHEPTELVSTDSCILKINYFNPNMALAGTLTYLMTPKDSILNFNTIINADNYPYIQLSARFIDTTNLTPAQLNRWHVLYQPIPEAAIDPSNLYTWLPLKDSVQAGEKIKFAVDVRNISDYPMDSLLVHYWIEDANRIKHPLVYPRQDSLRVLQTLRDTIEIETANLDGTNILWMEVNPYINAVLDQPEQYHFNNLLHIPFNVSRDKINPLLDVTFDGIHILNKDIVSPKSEILITLKDENPYLIMNELADTAKFGIYLTDPNGVQKRIPFIDNQGNQILFVTPATNQNKRFKILYNSDFQMNGVYTLLVQGTDKSNNLSGQFEYRIQFEVIRESTITHMVNYPNPFSTSTRFAFTLTGSEVPDDIIIQIMTVTGKVVREITEQELGPIHIGRNITQYAWDGKDEFGDQLANGVYLYRVLSQIKGEDIKLRESGADKYFKKEFGKMMLIR